MSKFREQDSINKVDSWRVTYTEGLFKVSLALVLPPLLISLVEKTMFPVLKNTALHGVK